MEHELPLATRGVGYAEFPFETVFSASWLPYDGFGPATGRNAVNEKGGWQPERAKTIRERVSPLRRHINGSSLCVEVINTLSTSLVSIQDILHFAEFKRQLVCHSYPPPITDETLNLNISKWKDIRNQWALKHAEEAVKNDWDYLVGKGPSISPLLPLPSTGFPYLPGDHWLPDPADKLPGDEAKPPEPESDVVLKIGIIGAGAAGLFTG